MDMVTSGGRKRWSAVSGITTRSELFRSCVRTLSDFDGNNPRKSERSRERTVHPPREIRVIFYYRERYPETGPGGKNCLRIKYASDIINTKYLFKRLSPILCFTIRLDLILTSPSISRAEDETFIQPNLPGKVKIAVKYFRETARQ